MRVCGGAIASSRLFCARPVRVCVCSIVLSASAYMARLIHALVALFMSSSDLMSYHARAPRALACTHAYAPMRNAYVPPRPPGTAIPTDFDASLATVHKTIASTAILEGGRKSLDAGGTEVTLAYADEFSAEPVGFV